MSLSPAIQQSLGLSGKEIYSTALSLVKRCDSQSEILDYGAGQGRFLGYLIELGYKNLTGADIMPCSNDLKDKINWIEGDLNRPLSTDESKYDLITAIEVIEHLENPRATAREWKRLLKPNGKLVCSTPNNGSLRSLLALIFKGHFVSFLSRDYPAHITALTRRDIERILTESGFQNIEFHFTKKGLVPGLSMFTWQKLSFGLLSGEKFSDNIFVTAVRK